MKKTKVVMALACAVLLVGASVMGTLAYLTSETSQLKNTFTIGENVAITLDEAKTDEYGETTEDTDRWDGEGEGNQYKLMPGHNYVKDPTVHVTGEDCYVFVVVENGIADIEATDNTIANQIGENNWEAVPGYDNLFVYATGDDDKTVVTAGDDLPVFGEFTVDSELENGAFDNYENAVITIKAYAVQTVDFEDSTPADIWAATFAE